MIVKKENGKMFGFLRKFEHSKINVPLDKYMLFSETYNAELENSKTFYKYIDIICANNWRQQYDMWCQCIRE